MIKQFAQVICLLLALGLPALAQSRSTSADLTGTVLDPSKAPVRGATVVVTNIATGLARNSVSDENGVYRIPLLPPGEYEVMIQVDGFSPLVKKGVILTVGQTLTFNLELTPGSIKETMVVDMDAPLMEPERTSQSSTITQRLINELPIDGRNFLDFTKLTPGVVEESPQILNIQFAPLKSSGLSFSGQNGRANTVQIDGVDNNDGIGNGVRPTLSQEAVNEFQINRDGYSAEFGRASGGVINLVSKSGTNQFHGNFYNFFRNESLDARNTFATALAQDPPFKRNQPGFTFGGPIRRDKTFFFISYEGLFRRESAFTTILADPTILNPSSGQQQLINALITSGAPALVAQGQQLQSMLTTSPNSSLQSVRNAYNLLNTSYGAFPQRENMSTGSVRIDHGLSDQDFLFARYSMNNDGQTNVNVGGLIAPSAGLNVASRDNTFVIGETHLFSSGLSNEFRFQYVRNVYNVTTADPFGPRYEVNGVASFGRDYTSPSSRTQRRSQVVDNLSLTRGPQNIKFGFDFSHYNVPTVTAPTLGGRIEFGQVPIPLSMALDQMTPGASASLANSLSSIGRSDLISTLQQPLTTVQQFGLGFARSFEQGFGNPSYRFSGGNLGVYLQDGIKVRSNLYLSLGLRYDYDIQPSTIPRDNNNVGPRFGFSYDPFKSGRTVIRGGGGLYYQSLLTGLAFISNVFSTGQITGLVVSANPQLTPIAATTPCGQQLAAGVPPSICFYQSLVSQGILTVPSTATIPQSAYMSLLGQSVATSVNRSLIGVASDASNSYSAQANLSVEHQFGHDFSVSFSYLFDRGLNLIRPRQVNALPNPSTLDALGRPALIGRVNPAILANYIYETAGMSTYNGLSVSVNKRFSNHYQLIASYTFSKAISDTGDLNFEEGPQDPTNTRADRSLSSFDVRHRLSVAGVVESPFNGGAGSSFLKRFLSGFYLSPIVTARSGFPFDIETGVDINLDTNNNDRPLLGQNSLGRNVGLGPTFFTTDLRTGRKIRFSNDKPLSLELIFDAFNIFNRTNFRDVNNITGGVLILDPSMLNDGFKGLTNKTASQFLGFTSAYDPRIVQIGAKFSF